MMLKRFAGMMLPAVCAVLMCSGCGVFDNGEAGSESVPGAIEDPAGEYSDISGRGMGGAAGAWQEGAQGELQADSDGLAEADPSGNRLGMPIIYFAYDSDTLVPSETAKLDAIAAYLADKSELWLVIQGHCDQRGTEEYNRALGERRANAVRAYLAGKGVNDAKMKTVSFGKDQPAVEGSGEDVWSQNRRAVPVPMIKVR